MEKIIDSQNNTKKTAKRRSGLKIVMQLIGLVKPMIPIMITAIILGVLGFLCAIFISIMGGYAILSISGVSQNSIDLSKIFAVVIIMAILRGVLRYGEQASNHYIAFKLLAIIRDKVFKALRKLAPAKLEGRDKGNLISIITSDIELLEVFYAHTISPVCIAFLTCLIMVIFFAQYSFVAAIIATIAYISVGIILPMITSNYGKDDGNKYRQRFGEINTYLLDSIRGLKEVIQYGYGNIRIKEIDRQSDYLADLNDNLKKCEGKSRANCDSLILIFSFIMLITCAILNSKGKMTIEGTVICSMGMLGSFGPVTALSNLANNLLHTFASGNRILDILEEKPLIEEVSNKEKMSISDELKENIIDCKNIDFAYLGNADEIILKDVSLEISKGEILGISGKSGSGKSTLIKLMMRFFDASSGEIKISGKNIKDWNTEDIRNSESYVIQDTYLFVDSIENNVKLANLNATHEEIVQACKKANIHEFIETLPNGYDTIIGEGHHQLSGGERQRIGIARAFLHDSDVILLDEPTSNLDSLNEGAILKVLNEERSKKTIIIVSHRQSTMKIADRVIKMKDGRAS
ncbi:amino acid ABC transporter ATP-binding/permease protein [Peptacetobacter sp.]|uniref:amino acid ABC transporter ATP-binding/permease protein n=1 Tax=Peptacetobacter sp. TaxID=2991975 RepID=UPI002ED625BD